ncbi:MAG: adenylate/guanylate cyclase domain-containing protein [Actinomycetia bacterium]|nr:adenylate/guanylate cyclase domain-containing protein [Actinomycetes bacterium]
MKNITVATRIAIVIMLVAVGALGATLIYGAIVRDDLTRAAIEGRAIASGTAKTDELSRYLNSIESSVLQMASSDMTVDAAQRFAATYKELPGIDTLSDEQAESLLSFYRDEFIPGLEAARGRAVSLRSAVPATDSATYLQASYFAAAEEVELDAALIEDAGDGSSWSEVHRELHPLLRDTAIIFGFNDVLIIDPQTSAIVYTAAKKTDFGTSMEVGPIAGSAITSIVETIVRNPVEGTVTVADFSRYDPDIAAPRAFAGSPIFDGDRLVGVLIVKIAPDEISRITTQDADWAAMHLGDTGEIFVVGSDGLMRSDSRRFLEQPDDYFESALAAGTLDSQGVDGVTSAETTVMFQRMGAATLDAIEQSNDEIADSTNYLGSDVLMAAQSIENPFGDWTLVFQVGTDEALASNNAARIASSISVALFVLVLTFVASSWAEAFMRPVRVLSMRLHALAGGTADAVDTSRLDMERTRTTREFTELTDTIDVMLESLADREEAAMALEIERREIVRQFLPEDVAKRVESGDRSIEHVEKATVVSVVIGGIGRLAGNTTGDVARDSVEHMIEDLDATAHDHGLRRVKVVGDAWVAVCGLDTPHVDHIARSIRVAIGAVRLNADVGQDTIAGDTSVGIATGPVSAGLAGSDHLMYDAWGPTVAEAGRLARLAPAGAILISEPVVRQLPADISVTEGTDASTSRVTWSIDLDSTEAESRP